MSGFRPLAPDAFARTFLTLYVALVLPGMVAAALAQSAMQRTRVRGHRRRARLEGGRR